MNMVTVGIHCGSEHELSRFKERAWPVTDAEHYGNKMPKFNFEKYILVAKQGDEFVGYCKVNIDTGVGLIDSLIVDPGLRGTGIGTQLLEATELLLKEKGAHKVWLETGVSWKAKSFYAKHGYVERAILPNHYGNQDFVLFDKML